MLAPAAGGAGMAALAHALPSVCVLGQWVPARLEALPAGVCRWRGPASRTAVSLTFDDGPSPASTPRTLDLLDELGWKATFFVVGSLAAAHPELVVEMRRRGHAVGLHGQQHRHHLLHSWRWIRRDTEEALRVLDDICPRPRWYRPPYGQLSTPTLLEARRQRLEVVLWSAWGREWAEPDASSVQARLAPLMEPGAVVLLHDSEEFAPPGTARRTHETLRLLAPVLSERSLRAVTLDALVDG